MANSITPTQGNLGIVSNRTTLLSYSVTTDGTMGTITEKVNGVTVGTRNAPVSGQNYTVSLSQAQWDVVRFGKYADTLGGKNTLEITMGDNTWAYTFDKRPANDADILSAVKAVKDSQEVHLPNIKRQLVDKVGGSVADSFEEIIGGAVLGRKMASGSGTTDTNTRTLIRSDGTSVTSAAYGFDFSMLSFTPSRLEVALSSKNLKYITVWHKDNYYDNTASDYGNVLYGTNTFRVPYVNGVAYLPASSTNVQVTWTAYE